MGRQLALRLHRDDLIVDNFAGGGGASVGIEQALGRSPDIAVNHDPEAIAMHAENHPATRHFCASVFDIDPVEATQGRRVGLAWFSPDCTYFSKARGGRPFRDRDRARRRRGLAWVVVRWAKAVRPRVICLENVEEFEDWGPLDESGKPCPRRRGLTFRRWLKQLQGCGYHVEWRQLRACDYGAPTTRKRLFLIARCDGEPIVWPEPTHGPGLEPHRPAADCIEWQHPCPSIFLSKAEAPRLRVQAPLAEKTMRRIARGVFKFVIDAAEPFIVPVAQAMVSPTLIQTSYGERKGQAPRVPGLHKPLGTVVAGGIKHSLVMAYLAKHYGGNEATGSGLGGPFHTITSRDSHALVAVEAGRHRHAEVRAFLTKWYGTGVGASLREPAHTVTTRDRFGLVAVAGEDRLISDIGMRMLVPRELYNANGFPRAYRIDFSLSGKPITKTAQVRMAGNSVPPPLVAAIVRANAPAIAASARRTA